jgi:hypothetical protein
MTLTEIHDCWAARQTLDAFWAGRKICGICLFGEADKFCSIHFDDGDYLMVEKTDNSLLTFEERDL